MADDIIVRVSRRMIYDGLPRIVGDVVKTSPASARELLASGALELLPPEPAAPDPDPVKIEDREADVKVTKRKAAPKKRARKSAAKKKK